MAKEVPFKISVLMIALISIIPVGCSGLNHTENGALLGSGVGAATGAIIGHQSGQTGVGALVGAGIGGLTGGLIGNGEDEIEKRDAMLASQQAQSALTNYDIVQLAQAGLGDNVIIGSIKSRGGRFDLSPPSLISLKQQGVTDQVLQYMQQNASVTSNQQLAVVQPANVIIKPVVHHEVVVAPQPVIGFHHGGHHRRHHKRHRSGLHIHW